MRRIWKFQLDLAAGQQTLPMPHGAEVLDAQMQFGRPALWALVDASAPKETRTFCVLGTGHDIPLADQLVHLGTGQDNGFVWHIFEVRP